QVDGLARSALLGGVRIGSGLTVEPLDLRPALRTELGRTVVAAADALARVGGDLVTAPGAIRPDLQLTGVLLDEHVAEIGGLEPSGGRSVTGTLGELLELRATTRDLVGFGVGADGAPWAITNDGDRILGSRLDLDEPLDLGRVDSRLARAPELLGRVLGRLPNGVLDGGDAAPNVRVRLPGNRNRVSNPVEAVTRARSGGARSGGATEVPSRPRATLFPPVVSTPVVRELSTGLTAHLKASVASVVSTVPQPAPLDLAGLGATMVAAVDPHQVIEARVQGRIGIVGGLRVGEVDLPTDRFRQRAPVAPIMVGPQLPEPLYAALAAHDQERFLPGAAKLPANAITLMETNPRFVEGFLVGANHEMNRELLWRKFPTDRRGTPFHHFWDRIDGGEDIGPIHLFNGARRLGGNSVGQIEGSLVLLVRGDLLRRYPNSIVYAAPALADRTLDPDPDRVVLPVFDGQLAPDITFVGFDLTVEDVLPGPGWFFVIQEQPSEPRFGLDEPDGGPGGGAPASWADLNWAHPGTSPGGWLSLGSVGSVSRTLAPSGTVQARWGDNAAHMAAITFQRTFRVAVHSDEVLDGTGRRP
ncbi:MAG: hypothetical protein WBL35_17515, partial [Ornithinibacter sp.]